MHMHKNLAISLVIGTLILASAIYLSKNKSRTYAPTTAAKPVAMTQKAPAINAKAGSYEMYAPEKIAKAETGKVVLFFKANWCSTCDGVDEDIKDRLAEIPEKLTLLEVDYDDSSALKRKYGVTYQHTFVQVDKDGNMLKKWSGSPTLKTLVAEVI